MKKMTVLKNGNCYTISNPQDSESFDKLPSGVYSVKYNERSDQYFLERADNLVNPKKIYGSTIKDASRIIRSFEERPNQTGVLLSGEKGSGKTLLAREVSIKLMEKDIPTIIINEPYFGESFNQFIQNIAQPCVVLFDEFEKIYKEEDQEKLLTLFDGVYPTKKLFILTINDEHRINFALKNRPGRMYYFLSFRGLDESFIREYCKDVNFPDDKTDQIVQISGMYYSFTFDMLQTIVEECNRFDEMPKDVIHFVNVNPLSETRRGPFTYSLYLKDDAGEKLLKTGRTYENIMSDDTHYIDSFNKNDDDDSCSRSSCELTVSRKNIVKITSNGTKIICEVEKENKFYVIVYMQEKNMISISNIL